MSSMLSKATNAIVKENAKDQEQMTTSTTGGWLSLSSSSTASYVILNNAFWLIDKVISILDGSKFSKKDSYLEGNYAPIHSEVHFQALLNDKDLPLPSDFPSGAFIRVGPNPYFQPVARYHWFDGDGMAHAVRIKDGTASYCNRFVDTHRLREEKKAGYATCHKIGDTRGRVFGLIHILLHVLKKKSGVINPQQGLGTANTALAFHASKLLSLNEGDLPYQLHIACDGLISTIGRVTFDGVLSSKQGGRPAAFTAHPKIDPDTGEMFSFAYSVEQAPYLWFTRINKQGIVEADFPVSGLRGPIMMHDCALSQNFIIFIDAPLFFKPEMMIKKGTLPFEFDKSAPLRLGVMPRNAENDKDLKWFDIEPGMCFHVANAWEEEARGGETRLHVYLCTFKDFSLDKFTAVSKDAEPKLTRVLINLHSGQVQSTQLLSLSGDFPVVPSSHVARPTKYAYVATMKTSPFGSPIFYGVAKVDLSASSSGAAVAGLIEHGTGRIGGECYFVPKKKNNTNDELLDEDDGYLMTYVFDESKNESEFVAYDAKTMSSTPIVKIPLRARVPFGFHCTFVSEEQMHEQALVASPAI